MFGRENALASISCVRSRGLVAAGAAADGAAAADAGAGGFCMLGMSCVPGMRGCAGGTDGGGGGLVPVGDRFVSSAGIAPAAACWNAPRWESALLTARGDTCETAGAGSGAVGTLGTLGAGGAGGAGGGPYGVDPGVRDEGDAVEANGLTLWAPGGPYTVDGTLICGAGAGALGGPATLASRLSVAGSTAGAPHAAQNFREPMSSAPHFAQLVMEPPS